MSTGLQRHEQQPSNGCLHFSCSALMGDLISVGDGLTCRPVTYRLPWTPPGWQGVGRMFWRHNSVEIDCVDFAEDGTPLWWAVSFMALRLTKAGVWERPSTQDGWERFREQTQFACPESAVAHAYKYRYAKMPNAPALAQTGRGEDNNEG